MKSSTFPCLRVEPELRETADSVLRDGETPTSMIETAFRETIRRCRVQQEFIARGQRSRGDAAGGRDLPLRRVRAFATAAAPGREAQVGPGVSAGFVVRDSDSARQDLLRLFDYLLDRAKTAEDFDAAQLVVDGMRDAAEQSLSRAPFVYRKAGDSPFLRELLIPSRGAGCVALYETKDAAYVMVRAVRHQLEDDYH